MANLRDKLMAFLDVSARKQFAWGQSDCLLDVADWLKVSCDLDVASEWRGNYSDEAGATAILVSFGGIENAMRSAADKFGLLETPNPQYGDVALVDLVGQDKPLAAIMMPSKRWRMKTINGIVVTGDVTVLVAWSLPCRPSSAQR